ncbi:MAG: DUF7544 domain-containing protein [Candidatus Acidiferrales bacterium]
MPEPLSAVDAVSPAIDHTRRHLFAPFRFAKWARLAVITCLSGEIVGGGGGGGTGFQFPAPPRGGGSEEFHFLQSSPAERWLAEFLPWILLGLAGAFALALLFIYINSVFRFLLFDAVLNDRWRLREGWGRWASRGASFFLWQIGYLLTFLAVLAALVGLPILLALQAGWFKQADQHVGAMVLGVLAVVLLGFVAVIGGLVIAVLAKDFVVPVMALEDVGVIEGWRRALPLMSGAKLSYAGYIGMKIVLAIAAGILFGILGTIAVLLIVFPLAILGGVLAAAGAFSGLAWTPATIAAAGVLGLAALALLIYVVAFISVPSAVFFQAYTLHFYAGRYPPLAAALEAAPSAAAPAAAG